MGAAARVGDGKGQCKEQQKVCVVGHGDGERYATYSGMFFKILMLSSMAFCSDATPSMFINVPSFCSCTFLHGTNGDTRFATEVR